MYKFIFSVTTTPLKVCSFLFFLSLVFVSCKKETQEMITPISSEHQEILDYFALAGYDTDLFEFKTEYVSYNQQISWSIATMLMSARGESNCPDIIHPEEEDRLIIGDRQRGLIDDFRMHTVSKTNINQLYYYVDPGVWNNINYAWVNAIHDAAEAWNDITYCRIILRPIAIKSFADIVITTDIDPSIPIDLRNLPSNVAAHSVGPTNGEAGPIISINTSFGWYTGKQIIIMQNLGHCLGFYPTGGTDGQHIHGTPATQNNSVLNPTTWSSSTTFQSGDIRMARLFYPQSLTRPDNYSVSRSSAGTVRIVYRNPNPTTKPYYWMRITKYTQAGNILAERFVHSTPNNTGTDILFWSGHGSGRYRFAVRGYNFRRDVYSSRTSKLSVSL